MIGWQASRVNFLALKRDRKGGRAGCGLGVSSLSKAKKKWGGEGKSGWATSIHSKKRERTVGKREQRKIGSLQHLISAVGIPAKLASGACVCAVTQLFICWIRRIKRKDTAFTLTSVSLSASLFAHTAAVPYLTESCSTHSKQCHSAQRVCGVSLHFYTPSYLKWGNMILMYLSIHLRYLHIALPGKWVMTSNI